MKDVAAATREIVARQRRNWLPLAIPLVVLIVEVAVLTLTVEYRHGLMRSVASPLIVQAILVGVTLLLLLRGSDLARQASLGHVVARLFFVAVNLTAFAALFRLSLTLAKLSSHSGASLADAALWMGLTAVVGMSALLIGSSWSTLRLWIATSWHQAVGTLILGAALAYLTPTIQQLWRTAYWPTLRISHQLLKISHPGEAIFVPSDDGLPRLGLIHKIELIVTPACADMESLAIFFALGTTLAIAGAKNVRWERWLAVMAAGALLLFLANAARLALLVELGNQWGSQWSVRLAHSRFGGILFLAIGAGWLARTRPWWGGENRTNPDPLPHPPEKS